MGTKGDPNKIIFRFILDDTQIPRHAEWRVSSPTDWLVPSTPRCEPPVHDQCRPGP
jgi:hypothetical protein